MPNKLISPVVKLSKQKMITGTILDVLGARCSVQLSGQGAKLHSLKFVGPTPARGETVVVDYRSGTPVVYTNSENLEERIAEAERALSAAITATSATPAPAPETAATQEDPVSVDRKYAPIRHTHPRGFDNTPAAVTGLTTALGDVRYSKRQHVHPPAPVADTVATGSGDPLAAQVFS